MDNAAAVILAAGKGTRMHSDTAKVLHLLCGRPMLSYALAAAQGLDLARILVVVGHQAERIKKLFAGSPVEWVVQSKQLGTAHAVNCALPKLRGFTGSILICCGDTPLLTTETLSGFLRDHVKGAAGLSILSMVLEQPGAYGRIIRDAQGNVLGIVEAKDASERERHIQEVNTGIYCAGAALLHDLVPKIDNTNAQGEYYLTDLVQKAVERGNKVQAMAASDPNEFFGVNTREELKAAAKIISQRMSQAAI